MRKPRQIEATYWGEEFLLHAHDITKSHSGETLFKLTWTFHQKTQYKAPSFGDNPPINQDSFHNFKTIVCQQSAAFCVLFTLHSNTTWRKYMAKELLKPWKMFQFRKKKHQDEALFFRVDFLPTRYVEMCIISARTWL